MTLSTFFIIQTFLSFFQGDRELEMGLPLSPLCDRSVTCIPESQLGTYRAQRYSFFGLLTGMWKAKWPFVAL